MLFRTQVTAISISTTGAFNGKFDVNKRDSGAIIIGAFCANNSTKTSFSTRGKRVTSANWGCRDIVTAGYGGLHNVKNAEYTGSFSGTSSENPIIAGVVAGTSLAAGDSAKVDTHPNMVKAVEKIMEFKEGDGQSKPVTVTGKNFSVKATSESSRTYASDASAILNAVSYRWTIIKGTGKYRRGSDLPVNR